MPLKAAQEILNNPDATLQELHECIGVISIEIGHLYCRCQTDSQLTVDLVQLEETLSKLEEKYDAKSSNFQQDS